MKATSSHVNRPEGWQRTPGQVTNKEFADADKEFARSCEGAGVEPTARQASKWRRHCGRAYDWHRAHPKSQRTDSAAQVSAPRT